MTAIADGVTQYNINAPRYFKIEARVKRNILNYKLKLHHDGINMRNEMTGANLEYYNMINMCDTDYDFLSWWGFVADYLHAFKL